ncbi:MAG TPA: class I SAM-dependent methyltransferase [Aliicoccus persicus]|uniref:Class I SAM-dependent methyltransferase n=1 Tax=Aliicoccus persicus TaxID=930138 RepID=A0A921DXL3_9STAP|nr:class I SAM-dependent methyltransferase [Aliicoccus persicus]
MLNRILPHAKTLTREIVEPSDIVVDATCGNGHDTLFLSNLVPDGKVYSFDIQPAAIESAKEKTGDRKNITYILDSHANVECYITVPIKVAMFNLGYLPQGDKSITTMPASTIEAVDKLYDLLEVGGRIVIVVYHGHATGKVEKDALQKHLMGFDQEYTQVLQYQFINQANEAPFLIVIEKIKAK